MIANGENAVPRIRTIKPDFFQHEELYDAERDSGLPLRIAFAGLWTVADKAGRFEWRPRQLKLNVLPYDDVNFDSVLDVLEMAGFLIKYEMDGKVFGCIPSWERHQHTNVREPDSTIPAPVKAGACTSLVLDQTVGKGKERKGKEVPSADEPPPGLDLVVWQKWLNYRTQIRRPLKQVSIPAAQRELAAFGAEQAAVVEQSIANGWQGLFALKPKANGKPVVAKRPPTDDEIAAARKAAAEANVAGLRKLGFDVLKAMP